jgi:ATP-dependent Clp protease ATP-binding subunit ClpB
MPTELDELERRLRQLEIERQAVQKDAEDPGARDRLEAIHREVNELTGERDKLRTQWQTEKEAISAISSIKERMEETKTRAAKAEREGDLAKAAELRYGVLIALQKDLDEKTAQLEAYQKAGSLLKEQVDDEDIAEVVSKWTGIPVSKMLEGEVEKMLKMEDRLGSRVIGQKEAVQAVSNAVRRARAGIQDPNRPIGSFIFLGPTGVGKTELAKALAWFLFDNEQAMIRLDMSEYMEKHAVSRLVGAPPGYVGYEEGGQLTEAVRRRPYSVLLFDEIEKAHPDVFNMLLQILDDGRLTDSQGRTVDFKNTVVIMTSNLGAHAIQELGGRDDEEARARVMDALRAHFRPEFLNRVDDIVLFHSLTLTEIMNIVDIQLGQLKKRLAERKMDLVLTDQAKEWLARAGFDPVYGARPLKRAIQSHLQNPLALKLLEGQFKEGDRIQVDLADDTLTFQRLGKTEPAGAAT